MLKRKPKVLTPEQVEEIRTRDFFDMILPGTIKFLSDHYIVGDSYRCVWAIREYPPSTEEQAILSQLADRNGVTLRIYHRLVESMEQRKIIQNATRRNRLKSGGNDVSETIEAEGNLQDVIELLANLRKNKEPLLHVSVFIELKARSMEKLKELQSDIAMELTRSKISVDRLTLRQKEGFLSVLPVGANQFGAQYERVLPASSVANMYPFNFSGKTDPHGSYIGRDKYGTNILVDFDRRAEDKTTSNILILGNSGQGKSYLLKLILTNIRESGKRIICLDPESEYEDLCDALGGCYIDFMSGEYTINPLEPKAWTDSVEDIDATTPEAFKKVTRLSQHIAFLKDFFRSYKDFTDSQIDTIEILLSKLYARFGITDTTDYSVKKPSDFPIMEDFYKLCEEEFMGYDKKTQIPLHRGNAPRGLPRHSLYVRRLGKQILQRTHQHHRLQLPCIRCERAYGYQPPTQGLYAVQYPVLYEQRTARQRQHGGIGGRAVPLPLEHDYNRISAQLYEACAQKGLLGYSGKSEYRGLFDSVDP